MSASKLRPAIFLDRDGTMIEERHYLADPDGVVLEAGAAEALARLQAAGFALVMISNQSGIGRGRMTHEDVERVNARLEALLGAEGVVLDKIYFCPHAPDDGCACRKPGTGMIEAAKRDLALDLGRSVVIGDKDADLLCAGTLGMKGILVTTGHGPEHADWARTNGFTVCRNLEEAVAEVLAECCPERLG